MLSVFKTKLVNAPNVVEEFVKWICEKVLFELWNTYEFVLPVVVPKLIRSEPDYNNVPVKLTFPSISTVCNGVPWFMPRRLFVLS